MEKQEPKFTFNKEFHDIVTNKEVLKRATEKFFYNLIDEITLGIIFDLHRKYKTNAFSLDCDDAPTPDDESTNIDVFGQYNLKKNQECVCPNCERAVAAARFAPHLESCMGMGRVRSRNATRRVASNSKERENSSYSGSLVSDDEDDADWNSRDKRRKKKDRNGNKKGKGTPKKNSDPEPSSETVNVDVEGDEDEVSSLRDLLQDHSNGSSPVDSASTSNSSTGSAKKRDKIKSKKSSKRDRSSPSGSLNLD